MALVSWLAGWAVARRFAWEPAAAGVACVSLIVAADALRDIHRLLPWAPRAAGRRILRFALALAPPCGILTLLGIRTGSETWLLALALPAILYAPILLAGLERLATARVLLAAGLAGAAPATYALATGAFGTKAAVLWASLTACFILASAQRHRPSSQPRSSHAH